MGRGKARFAGAGASAEREFSRRRRQNILDEWRVWVLLTIGAIGFLVWSFYVGRIAGRLLAGVAGSIASMMFLLWSLGGHISAFHWWLGAEGERATAKEIEKLGPEWYCEHDLEHAHGNWDHVLVGPAGIFLLDSKLLHGTSAAGDDSLRAGRMVFRGAAFRAGAVTVNQLVERQLGWKAPWVQAVVVIWGDFPQNLHEEQKVVYLRGEELRHWLATLPAKVNAPQRAALVEALREARASLPKRDEAVTPAAS